MCMSDIRFSDLESLGYKAGYNGNIVYWALLIQYSMTSLEAAGWFPAARLHAGSQPVIRYYQMIQQTSARHLLIHGHHIPDATASPAS